VYAFFPEILGGKNINLDVLRSCEEEWFKHGVGAARLGSTLLEKLLNTPWYLVSDWRFAPVTAGICLPAVLFGWHTHRKFFTLAGLLGFLYIGYQYCISGFYWYHIIALFPILGVFTARFLAGLPGRWLLLTAGVLILAAGVNPGVSYSLMGSKLASTHLPMFAHPGVSPSFFYQYVYPDVSAAWHYINTKVEKNSLLLSHDNRYHVFRDDIQIIHLDDCGLTPLYGKPYRLVHEKLLERGIRYYLYIPDEDTHPITRQLGHRDSVDDPRYFQKVFEKPVSYADGRQSWAVLYRLMEP
jgi:hypothetical protein